MLKRGSLISLYCFVAVGHLGSPVTSSSGNDLIYNRTMICARSRETVHLVLVCGEHSLSYKPSTSFLSHLGKDMKVCVSVEHLDESFLFLGVGN